MEEITRGTGTGGSMRPRIEGAGMDLDPSRRPGVPRMHDPQPLPNSRFPPARQQSDVKVFMHGRRNKQFPPVFGTDAPPKGLSGKIREAAYRYPDHYMRHWTMLLFADRVDSWEHRLGKVVPALVVGLVGWAAVAAAGRRG
jgi:hypothetical protein